MNIKKIISITAALLIGVASVPKFSVNAADYTANKSRVSVHDPSVFRDENTGIYYVFGSHIDAAKSPDLQSWKLFTNGYATSNNKIFGSLSSNLAGAFAWAGENLEDCEGGFAVWAPDVIWNPDFINSDGSKGAYLMYFCTSSTYKRSVIAFAASKNPEGPYNFVDTLIYSGFTSNDSYAKSSTKNVNRKYTSTNIDELIAGGQVTYNENWFNKGDFNNTLYPNAIDPTICTDTDGKMYMCYGSWSGGIFTLEIDKQTGRCIHPKAGTTADGRMIDSYFGTKISGGYGKSGEGPFIEYNAETDYYYLWVTYGGLFSDGGYNMRVFRSKSPLGPFTDTSGKDAVLGSSTNLDSVGLKIMTNHKFNSQQTAYMACGHNSVLKDSDGKWYLINHARFDDNSEYHEVRVHSMSFNEKGWPVVMPFEYSGEGWSENGFETSDIVGSYEFINHGTATNGNITKSSSITLGADGSISGAVNGTWHESETSASATFTIGGVTYYGRFNTQFDESKSGRKVLAFTGVGGNNQTVWAVKNSNCSERNLLKDYTNPDSKLTYSAKCFDAGSLKISQTTLLSGIPYYIENINSGKLLDVSGDKIQQWQKNGKNTQEWRITDLGNGYCSINSMADEDKCITISGSSAENGLDVSLQEFSGADNQLFRIVSDGGSFAITSKCSDNTACLDVYEWSTENGGAIKQWEHWGGECQLWSITPVHPTVPNGSYSVRNIGNSLWLNNDLPQSEKQSVWKLEEIGGGFYTISASNGLAVTVSDSADLTLQKNEASVNQQFALQCNLDGSYSLLSAASLASSISDKPTCIDVNSGKIELNSFSGNESQKFVLIPSVSTIGDVNADGCSDIADVVLLQRYILSDSVQLYDYENGDITKDGIIDAFDAAALKKMLVG